MLSLCPKRTSQGASVLGWQYCSEFAGRIGTCQVTGLSVFSTNPVPRFLLLWMIFYTAGREPLSSAFAPLR
jgi:hypothetical protein